MLKLFIGNKNYSSWSMRPWVLMHQAGIKFDEIMVRFDSFEANSEFKKTLSAKSPTGKVPLLQDGELFIWDTLAIAEYLAETFPERNLWPKDKKQRARARSYCAEMHSSFTALRSNCPMNIEAGLSEIGAIVWRDKPAVQADVARISAMWEEALARSNGPMLFGEFSIADAYFAPVVSRFQTYALPVSSNIAAYMKRVFELDAVAQWKKAALAEKDFIAFDEPYRSHR